MNTQIFHTFNPQIAKKWTGIVCQMDANSIPCCQKVFQKVFHVAKSIPCCHTHGAPCCKKYYVLQKVFHVATIKMHISFTTNGPKQSCVRWMQKVFHVATNEHIHLSPTNGPKNTLTVGRCRKHSAMFFPRMNTHILYTFEYAHLARMNNPKKNYRV